MSKRIIVRSMDVVRSYVVPSLHFAEVVHLREDEDSENDGEEEDGIMAASSSLSSSSTSCLSLHEKNSTARLNGFISSLESNTSTEPPSLASLNSPPQVLNALKRRSMSEEVSREGNHDNNNELDHEHPPLPRETKEEDNIHDTTQEIDIDAILGYPPSTDPNDISCNDDDDDAITVIEEQDIDSQRNYINELSKNRRNSSSKNSKKDKSSILDRIRATLSRKTSGNNVPNAHSVPSPKEDDIVSSPPDNLPNGKKYEVEEEEVSEKSNPESSCTHVPEEQVPFKHLNRDQSKRKSIFKRFVIPSDMKSPKRKSSNGHIPERRSQREMGRPKKSTEKPPSPKVPLEEDTEKSSSSLLQKSKSLSGLFSKYSEKSSSLPRRNRGRPSREEQEQVQRRRPRSLSRTKFALPSRRSSVVRPPSPETSQAQHPHESEPQRRRTSMLRSQSPEAAKTRIPELRPRSRKSSIVESSPESTKARILASGPPSRRSSIELSPPEPSKAQIQDLEPRSRRSSIVRPPSSEAMRPVEETDPNCYRSEPNIHKTRSLSRLPNPTRQYGRRSGRFRRLPPSQEVVTIPHQHRRSKSSERPSREEDQRESSLRSRQRASSLPRLNNSSRHHRRQGRSHNSGNDICSLQ